MIFGRHQRGNGDTGGPGGPAKIEDVKNAVTFLAGHDKINADRLAAVGVCAGGLYPPAAAVADRRIKAVATASGLPDLRHNQGRWRLAVDHGRRRQRA